MASDVAEQFMHTLQETERTQDVGPLAEMFTDDAELSNLSGTEPERGRDGANQLWTDYLGVFDEIASKFHGVIEGEGGIALEWTSEGRLSGGRPIRYSGVSMLETEGDRVKRFRTYYDSAAFVTTAPSEEDATPSDTEPRR